MISHTLPGNKLLGWLAAAAMATCSLSAQAEERAPIRIGWVNWSDTEIAVKLATTVLQDQLKQPVKLVLADIGIQFQAMANGNIDLIPMVWLPNTHKSFYDKYQDKLEDVAVLCEGKLGMAVPTSIPVSEIASIEDLNKPEVREKLAGKILTSEVGNGQYKLTEKAIKDYKLEGYKMVASSESGMLSELDRNLKRDKWSVINAWSPHWMFAKWPLRYLDDPKQIYGGAEQIHVVARKGFSAEHPDVARFFTNFKIPKADLEKMMSDARDSSTDKVVSAYYAANKPRFAAMVDGSATAATASQ